MTEDLREALHRAATAGEPAVGDAFARFTVVKRRAAIARSATVAVVGLTAAATLFFMLPGLNSGDTGGNLTGGDVTSSPPFKPVKHYEDTVAGFAFDYPAEWEIDAKEGKYVIVSLPGPDPLTTTETRPYPQTPPGCQDCGSVVIERPSRFYVRVQAFPIGGGTCENGICADSFGSAALSAREDHIGQRAAGATITPSTAMFAGKDVAGDRIEFPVEPKLVTSEQNSTQEGFNPYAWCAGCTNVTYPLPEWSAEFELIFEVVSPSADEASRYSSDVAALIESFARA